MPYDQPILLANPQSHPEVFARLNTLGVPSPVWYSSCMMPVFAMKVTIPTTSALVIHLELSSLFSGSFTQTIDKCVKSEYKIILLEYQPR